MSGGLTRAELTEALGVPARHAAVRVQRMKAQLETGRVVVRALAARPRCGALARLTADWDGRPAPMWRKRVARHVRGCRVCGGHRADLLPVEGLLAGLGLVVPLSGYPAVPVTTGTAASASGAAGGAHTGAGGSGAGGAARGWVPVAAGGVLVGGALLAALWPVAPDAPAPARRSPPRGSPRRCPRPGRPARPVRPPLPPPPRPPRLPARPPPRPRRPRRPRAPAGVPGRARPSG